MINNSNNNFNDDYNKIEINFKRLLKRCEQLAAESHTDYFIKNVDSYKTYLEVLNQQLAVLSKPNSEYTGPAQDVLNEYTRKIKFLTDILNEDKLMAASETRNFNKAQNLSSIEHNSEMEVKMRATQRLQKSNKAKLFEKGSPSDQSKPDSSLLRRHPFNAEEEPDDVFMGEYLANERYQQEQLTSDMADLAQNLKDNSLQMQEILKKDLKTIGKVSQLQETNMQKITIENHRIKQQIRSAKNTTCANCLVLLLVCAVFMATIFFIKLT